MRPGGSARTARATIAGRSVFTIVDAAAKRGIDPAPLYAVAGVRADARDDPDLRVPFARMYDAWEAIMRALRDPAFPIATAYDAAPAGYDVLGFLAATSPTFGDALRRVSRYVRLWTTGLRWEVREEDDVARLIAVREGPLRLGRRCSDEAASAELVVSARATAGAPFHPIVARFMHPSPPDVTAHRALFESRVEFDAPRTEIVFAREWMRHPMPKADAAMHRFFLGHAERALSAALAPATFAEDAERALLAQLAANAERGPSPWQVPSVADLARQLGMSERSLRRRLAEEGTTFEKLLTGVRVVLARDHLADRRLSIADIAYTLGFSEPSAFHRAFKRWTGETPLAFRRASAASARA